MVLGGTIVTAPFGKQIPTFQLTEAGVSKTLVATMQAFVEVHALGVANDAILVHVWLPYSGVRNEPLAVFWFGLQTLELLELL